MNANLDPPAGGGERAEGPPPPRRAAPTAEILPYVVPMFAYLTLGGIEGYLTQVDSQPSPTWYPIAYAIRMVVVAALAWHYRETWRDLRPGPGVVGALLAVMTGLVVTALWV